MKNWVESNTPGKRLFFDRGNRVYAESMEKEDQCTSIFHFADRPELPYQVDFWRKSFPIQIGVRKMWRFWDLFDVVLGVSEEILMDL